MGVLAKFKDKERRPLTRKVSILTGILNPYREVMNQQSGRRGCGMERNPTNHGRRGGREQAQQGVCCGLQCVHASNKSSDCTSVRRREARHGAIPRTMDRESD
ncbi:uncharacterized protein [Physcomitrium patens]|uniref:uncharacterized protein n=1 Tax=Physcomitrium patens TaxID=3218 RepID=UPI003CCD8632